jgi:hypothetical protein
LPNPLTIEIHEKNELIPKVGDLWIPITTISLHHRIRFFLSGIEGLFVVGNKVVRVEHKVEKSRNLVCKLGKDYEGNGCGTMSMRTKCTIV